MTNSNLSSISAARRNAEDYFAKTKRRDNALGLERDMEKAADAAKTAKLRALRLAKEAADNEQAEKETTAKAQGGR